MGSVWSRSGRSPYQMPQMPTSWNMRTFDSNTTLGIYRLQEGKIHLEKRMPAQLKDGEEHLRQTTTTLIEPKTPRVDVALAFDFPEPLRSLFISLTQACSHCAVADLEFADADIHSHTGISVLSERLLLEPLVCLAIAFKNYPLAKGLVAKGPPPPEAETKFLWNWRGYMAQGDDITDPTATTALLRHGWLEPGHAYATQMTELSDESAAIDRIDALLEVGYTFHSTPGESHLATYWWTLRKAVGLSPAAVLRHLLSRVPIPSDVPMYNSLVPIAAARTDAGPEIMELLFQQGLDVDARMEAWDNPPRATGLHEAVRVDSVPNIEFLLRRGARMLRDGEGRTPLELAEHGRRDKATVVLKDWLREKGVAFDYEDEEPLAAKV